jgi:sortase A
MSDSDNLSDVAVDEGGAEAWPDAGVGGMAAVPARRENPAKRVFGAVGFVLDAIRRRRSGRIVAWFLVIALFLAGIGLLVYPFATDIWAGRIQGGLEQQFGEGATQVQAYRSRSVAVGDALTKIRVPALGGTIGTKGVIVVEGTTGNALRAGAGHYEQTALPGDPTGNVAIAGHRTGFGEPFRNLHLLKQGDRIELATPIGHYAYEVIGPFDGHPNPWITSADDWSVVTLTPEPMLTLTTCDPPGTSKNRLIVRAQLVESRPIA